MKKINFYLWKLKFLEGNKISKNEIDKNNIPDNVYYSELTGKYTKIDYENINIEDLNKFIKVKNAYNLNIIRICVVICTVFFVIAVCSIM